MAFPTTGVLDTFDRNDEAPLGTNESIWASIGPATTNNGLQAFQNKCSSPTPLTNGYSALNRTTFGGIGADQELYFQWVQVPPSGFGAGILLRVHDIDESLFSTNWDAYTIMYLPASSTVEIRRRAWNLGSVIDDTLLATLTGSFVNGDYMGAQIIGSTIEAFKFATATDGPWVSLGTASDSNYTSGWPGIGIREQTHSRYTEIDNVFGGEVVVTTFVPQIIRYR